jgi:phosphatidylglycerol:prolipoprotein diacylglycerol transferase
MPADNGDGAARSQEVCRNESRQSAFDESRLMLVVILAVLPILPFPAINPILISIGPFAVRWYALAYIVGIIAGWFYARAIIASERLWGGPAPLTVIDFDDFVIWITVGIILGGRTGYVLFYNLPHFIEHPLQIFELWNGGMSFHGGVAGCIVAIVVFALKRGIPMLSLGDVVAAVCPIGLFLGRIANFVNGELWGRPTNVPWAMIFPNGGPLPRHPSQLYEATLEGIVLFVVLGLMVRFGALKRPGLVAGSFALGYGVARVTSELFREPDVQLGFLWGGMTMGMLLCIPLMLGGIAILTYTLTRDQKPKNG